MKCLGCKEEMSSRFIETINVDECLACGGIWFDGGELLALKDKINPDLNWMDFKIPKPDREAFPETCFDWLVMDYIDMPKSKPYQKRLLCTKCAVPTLPLNYKEACVQIDFCNQCEGIWIERGEFSKIIVGLESRMHSMSVADCICESLREAKEIFAGPKMVLSEWRDFSTVLRILHCKVLCERGVIAKALDAIRSASVSL